MIPMAGVHAEEASLDVDGLTLNVKVRVVTLDGRRHVEGVVIGPEGEESSFSGWMALLDQLERVVERRSLPVSGS